MFFNDSPPAFIHRRYYSCLSKNDIIKKSARWPRAQTVQKLYNQLFRHSERSEESRILENFQNSEILHFVQNDSFRTVWAASCRFCSFMEQKRNFILAAAVIGGLLFGSAVGFYTGSARGYRLGNAAGYESGKQDGLAQAAAEAKKKAEEEAKKAAEAVNPFEAGTVNPLGEGYKNPFEETTVNPFK